MSGERACLQFGSLYGFNVHPLGHNSGGALAEGFQARMFEFQNFERRFEVRAPDIADVRVTMSEVWLPAASLLTQLRLAGMHLSVGCEDQI